MSNNNTDSKPQKRPGSDTVRKRHLEKGAFLVEFATPQEPRDMFGGRQMPAGLGRPPLSNGREYQSVADKYRTMERKGFRVTADIGCLIPDEQYGTYQQGATIKGHQRAFAFFARWVPTQGSQAVRNEWGWPATLQISHLCHRRSCCRIDHLVAEEQWRNIKRNYCGISGACDCGNTVKCLRRYQGPDTTDEPVFCNSKDEAEGVLEGAPSFVIHGANRFEGRDKALKTRRQNKLKRKRAQESHEHVTARKRSRLANSSSVLPVSTSSDGESQS